ncbi:27 kDa antigen Cfp30B [Tolypocladium ophioglossoides CBS 100239]|uniref:27 kDa antigen Cfp30B n=1 Tax=Tolypocladium ophioglossoides (strain CBS 100239) TaxID=1163406 RepID=A0A0L0MY35_TOLOC|nr:27 kDa antigen Cfp30B [Tolypocladium ophioglossoides CBS 100239]
MSESNRSKHGEICWFEIPVSDASRAQKLYTDIFGWECKDEPVPRGDNGVKSMHFFNKASVHGAFLLMEEGHQQTQYRKLDKEVLPPLVTLCVEECNETLDKVKAHGGKMQCPKTEIGGDMGHFARFIDTEGNVIGIWSQH